MKYIYTSICVLDIEINITACSVLHEHEVKLVNRINFSIDIRLFKYEPHPVTIVFWFVFCMSFVPHFVFMQFHPYFYLGLRKHNRVYTRVLNICKLPFTQYNASFLDSIVFCCTVK